MFQRGVKITKSLFFICVASTSRSWVSRITSYSQSRSLKHLKVRSPQPAFGGADERGRFLLHGVLLPAAQRERRQAPAPAEPGHQQPADGGDKAAPQHSVKQDKEGTVEEREGEKKAQEEAAAVAAVSTKRPEESKFNVRRAWLLLL